MPTFQKVKLGDICDVRDGTHDSPKEFDFGYPLVTSKHIKNRRVDLSETYLISENDFEQINKRSKVDRWDILFSMIGTVGEIAFVKNDEKYAIKNVGLIKTGNERLGKYLFYYLWSPQARRDLESLLSGSTQKFISLGRLRDFPIFLPSEPEQARIAGVLAAYDDLIENNEKRIKALEQMAQLLYTEWFVKFNFPGHEKSKLIDSGTEYGMVPLGWEVKSFYDVVDNFDSKRKPISSMKRQGMQGVYPYYGAAKIIDYVNDYIFDGRYLLIAEDGSVITPDGKPMLQFVNEKFWVSNHAHIVQGKLLSTEILYLRLSRFNIKSLITGSAQPKITKDNLSRVLFIVPDENTKNMFTAIVSHYFDEIFNLQKQNQNLSQARDLLIPQLVTGKRELK